MTQKIGSIGIIKESRNDESRAPIAPEQIKELKIRIKENVNFKENQDQIFSVEQAMRYEDLEKIINLTEIVAVGIGLHKSE